EGWIGERDGFFAFAGIGGCRGGEEANGEGGGEERADRVGSESRQGRVGGHGGIFGSFAERVKRGKRWSRNASLRSRRGRQGHVLDAQLASQEFHVLDFAGDEDGGLVPAEVGDFGGNHGFERLERSAPHG